MTDITFVRVADVNDVVDGDIKKVKVGHKTIALFNLGGEFFALDHLCTHEEVSLVDGFVDGCEVECPKHSGRFDIKTGKATAAPCTVDARTYPIKITGLDVLVGIANG